MENRHRKCPRCGKLFFENSARFCDDDGSPLVESAVDPVVNSQMERRQSPVVILFVLVGILMILASGYMFFKGGTFPFSLFRGDTSKNRFPSIAAMLNKCYGSSFPDIPRQSDTKSEEAFKAFKEMSKKISEKATSTVNITLKDELTAGRTSINIIKAAEKPASSPGYFARIDPLLAKMRDLTPRGFDLGYQLTVFGGTNLNAAMFPGGQMMVWERLSELLTNDDQFASVIGHEIAHAELRHHDAILKFEKAGGDLAVSIAGMLGEDVGKKAGLTGGRIVAMAYDQDQEFEADRLGICIAHLAGYQQRGNEAAAAFTLLESASASERRRETPDTRGRAGPAPKRLEADSKFKILYDIISTHPSMEIRKEYAKSLSAQLKVK